MHLDGAFDRLLSMAKRLLGVELAALWLFDMPPPLRTSPEVSETDAELLQRFAVRVAELGAPLVVADAHAEPADPLLAALAAAGWRAVAAAPLVVGDQVIAGALCVVSATPRSWSDRALGDLQDAASLARDSLMLSEAVAKVKALEALAEDRRSRMFRMLERMTDGFVVIDARWRFLYLNRSAERLLALSLSEVVGRDVREACTLSKEPVFCDAMYHAATTGERVIVEGQIPGRQQWIEARIFPAPEGVFVYLHDTTDRVLAAREREARAASEARLDGVILASREAAHLLNNDIALPMGLVELMQMDPTLPEESRAMLGEIGRGLERLLKRVRQFQSITRVETKQTPLGRSLDLGRSSATGEPG
jgi:PAS domain S-box-containing protein